MSDTEIDEAIAEGLLAYFREGGTHSIQQPQSLRFQDMRRLLRLHWAFSPRMQSFLQYLLKRHGEIVSSSTQAVQQTMGSIRGPGMWPETYMQRHITANPALTIFRDNRRTYDLGANRVLKFVTSAAHSLLEPYASRSDLSQTPYGIEIRNAFGLATRAGRVLHLRQIDKLLIGKDSEPSYQDVKQSAQSRRLLYVLAARLYRTHKDIESSTVNDPSEIIDTTLVAPLYAWQRFELFSVLYLGLALSRFTGSPANLHDLTGGRGIPAITVDHFAIHWGSRPLEVRLSSQLPERRKLFDQMLHRYGLDPREGRSDITITDARNRRVLAVVECKYSTNMDGSTSGQFRDALNQLLDYAEEYEGDAKERLMKSAIVMRTLPTRVASRGGMAGKGDPIALSADDLLRVSEPGSLVEWLERLTNTNQ